MECAASVNIKSSRIGRWLEESSGAGPPFSVASNEHVGLIFASATRPFGKGKTSIKHQQNHLSGLVKVDVRTTRWAAPVKQAPAQYPCRLFDRIVNSGCLGNAADQKSADDRAESALAQPPFMKQVEISALPARSNEAHDGDETEERDKNNGRCPIKIVDHRLSPR